MSQSLPSTAYIKMIDIWMIFSMLYPFFVVLIYAILEVLEHTQNKVKTAVGDWMIEIDQGKLLRTVSTILDWGLPLLVTTFIILYWTLGLVNYTWPDIDNIC